MELLPLFFKLHFHRYVKLFSIDKPSDIKQFFGSLMGMGRMVIGLTSLINLPLIRAVEEGTITFVHVYVGYAIVAALSLILPFLSLRKAMASL